MDFFLSCLLAFNIAALRRAALDSLQPALSVPSQWRPGRRHDDGGASSAPGLPPLPAPPPTAGADHLPPTPTPTQTTAPHFGFPLQPTLGAAAPAPPAAAAAGAEGYPFIGSNPTVPLPTGMTDTATVLPLPDTGGAALTTTVTYRAVRGVPSSPCCLLACYLQPLSFTVLCKKN